MLNVPFPLSFNEEFFKWFDYKRWDKVKAIFKEMKRRRGKGHALKIDVSFTGTPKIRFIIDSEDSQWFNNSVEKIDFVFLWNCNVLELWNFKGFFRFAKF